jgi:hypothetical protein
MQLVEAYPDDFGDPLDPGEEPKAFLMVDTPADAYYISVASQSGSSRHRSHKRVFVSLTDGWKCRACPKDEYDSGEQQLVLT